MLTPFQNRARKALSESPFFGASIDDWVRWIHRTSLRKGDRLYAKGQPSDEFFGVVSGQIKLCSVGTNGEEIHFGQVGPGEIVGEIDILNGTPRHTSAIALSHCELATIRRRELDRMLELRPEFLDALVEASTEMTKRLAERIEESNFLSIEARVEKTFFDITRQLGEHIQKKSVSVGMRPPDLAHGIVSRGTSRSERLSPDGSRGACRESRAGRLDRKSS